MAMLLAGGATSVGGAATPADCPTAKSLCVQAERSGGIDLDSGTAILEGNVQGFIRAQELSFSADQLKAYRNQKNEWVRLVLDRNVRIRQPDSTASADHSVLRPEQVLLFGNGRFDRAPYRITGDEILVERTPDRITVRGTEDELVLILYDSPGEPPPGGDAAPNGTADATLGEAARGVSDVDLAPGAEPETVVVRALHAVIDEAARTVRLTGRAIVTRRRYDWRLRGESVVLHLKPDDSLRSFRAEGNVRIDQPERTLRAEVALSKNDNRTILLLGNARVEQDGEFQLSSDRMEVYTDANKGVVQSEDRQRPVKLSFNLAPEKPYLLGQTSLQSLEAKGVPSLTLIKLEPLLEVSYPTRAEFSTAVRGLLTVKESRLYLDRILTQAR